MKRHLRNTILIFTLIHQAGCEKLFMEKDPVDTPVNNFEILWSTLDTRYALFPYKQVDWDSIYQVYSPQVYDHIEYFELYTILSKMLLELRDGHTDISSSYDVRTYDYTNGAKTNYSLQIVRDRYLFGGTQLASGIAYNEIDSVGYIHVPSFNMEITDNDMRKILDSLGYAKGIIIDVRQNTGGIDQNAKALANHFFDKKRKVEIRYYKTGPYHDDLSSVDYYFKPDRSLKYSKPTVVLTNRTCFSACNSFVCWMSLLPHVLIAGDTTGGGSGVPHYGELPNGWVFRYSSNASFRPDGLNIDEGIPPDRVVYMENDDITRERDTMIDFAINYIRSQ